MKSIAKTITLTTIFWVATILIIGQFTVDIIVSNWLLRQFDAALESKARAFVTLTKFDGVKVELDFADEFMPEFESTDNPEYFVLFSDTGRLLEYSRSWDKFQPPKYSSPSNDISIFDVKLPNGRAGRQISIKFMPQIEDKILRGQTPLLGRPIVILSLSRERESLNQALLKLHSLIIALSIAVLACISLVIMRTTRAGLKPLLEMKNEISQITPKSIGQRITIDNQPLELEPIAIQFNLVLSEIEKAFRREREFSSDVAHELRTPVAEIRSLAEVALRWPDEKDVRSYFTDIFESSQQLDRLIENLLHLSRSEEGNIELEFSEVKITRLISQICKKLDSEIDRRHLTVTLPKTKLPTLFTDIRWLELLLHNLIYNAICYSPENSEIIIDCDCDDGYASVAIENTVLEPITDSDLQMMFERFWRKDSSRASGQHAGIGLSLVRSYAAAMDLQIDAKITENGNFRIILSHLKTT